MPDNNYYHYFRLVNFSIKPRRKTVGRYVQQRVKVGPAAIRDRRNRPAQHRPVRRRCEFFTADSRERTAVAHGGPKRPLCGFSPSAALESRAGSFVRNYRISLMEMAEIAATSAAEAARGSHAIPPALCKSALNSSDRVTREGVEGFTPRTRETVLPEGGKFRAFREFLKRVAGGRYIRGNRGSLRTRDWISKLKYR